MTARGPTFGLDAYLARIGYEGRREASFEVLRSVHLAHARTIPFEDLDIHLGRGISLDLGDVERKLVGHRRGGYCFEQNRLLQGALEALGFEVTPFAAWVGSGEEARAGLRTHMLLRVDLDAEPWIADVGFGASFVEPIPFVDGAEAEQDERRYRLVLEAGGLWVLQEHRPPPRGWSDLYAFPPEQATAEVFAEGNAWTSTHPDSPFVHTITAQLSSGVVRPILRGRTLIESFPDGDRPVATVPDAELIPTLGERFGIELPDGARLG